MDRRLTRLLAITFFATLAEIITGRGVYFYTEYELHFSERQNLLLALGMGASYAASAWTCHRLSRRLGMKRHLVAATLGVLVCDALLFARPTGITLVLATLAKAYCNMAKWPVIESYISAGRSPRQTADAIGRFNLAWSIPIPLGIALTGPIVSWWPPGLFLLAAAIELVELSLLRPLEREPAHLPDDHPDHLPAAQLRRYRALLVSGRWAQFSNAVALMLVSPLLPAIFKELGFGVILATALASVLDWGRVGAFFMLRRDDRWHGRLGLLAWTSVALPVAVLTVLVTSDVYRWLASAGHDGAVGQGHLFAAVPTATAIIVLATCLQGLTSGAAYFSSLYYSMVVMRASVEGGGIHEGLGALGMTVGPAAGLGAKTLGRAVGAPIVGTLVGAAPLFALLAWAGLRPLIRLRRVERDEALRGAGSFPGES